jgi:hypothetical protein
MTNAGPDDRDSLVGADVDRAWRALSREEPAASLDASILAAAHREAGARPQSVDAREARAMRRRWWPVAAAATVAAVAIGVLQLTPPEELGAPSAERATVSDMPVPSAKKPEAAPAPPSVAATLPPAARGDVAAPSGASENRVRSEAPRVAPSPRQAPATVAPEPMRQAPNARPAPPAAPAPEPEPFPAAPKRVDEGAGVGAAEPQAAPPARKEMAAPPAAGNLALERPSQAPAPASTAAAPAARMPERASLATAPLAKMAAPQAEDATGVARVKDRAPLPIPDWIALIRRLRDEGKTAEAAKELAAFRAAHANHEKLLPPDLRDWRPPEK